MTGTDDLAALWFLFAFCLAVLGGLAVEWLIVQIGEMLKRRRR